MTSNSQPSDTSKPTLYFEVNLLRNPFKDLPTYTQENAPFTQRFDCSHCHQVFNNIENLNDHMKHQHWLYCLQCNKKLEDESSLVKHYTDGCSQRSCFDCPLCNKNMVVEHMKACHTVRPMSGNDCDLHKENGISYSIVSNEVQASPKRRGKKRKKVKPLIIKVKKEKKPGQKKKRRRKSEGLGSENIPVPNKSDEQECSLQNIIDSSVLSASNIKATNKNHVSTLTEKRSQMTTTGNIFEDATIETIRKNTTKGSLDKMAIEATTTETVINSKMKEHHTFPKTLSKEEQTVAEAELLVLNSLNQTSLLTPTTQDEKDKSKKLMSTENTSMKASKKSCEDSLPYVQGCQRHPQNITLSKAQLTNQDIRHIMAVPAPIRGSIFRSIKPKPTGGNDLPSINNEKCTVAKNSSTNTNKLSKKAKNEDRNPLVVKWIGYVNSNIAKTPSSSMNMSLNTMHTLSKALPMKHPALVMRDSLRKRQQPTVISLQATAQTKKTCTVDSPTQSVCVGNAVVPPKSVTSASSLETKSSFVPPNESSQISHDNLMLDAESFLYAWNPKPQKQLNKSEEASKAKNDFSQICENKIARISKVTTTCNHKPPCDTPQTTVPEDKSQAKPAKQHPEKGKNLTNTELSTDQNEFTNRRWKGREMAETKQTVAKRVTNEAELSSDRRMIESPSNQVISEIKETIAETKINQTYSKTNTFGIPPVKFTVANQAHPKSNKRTDFEILSNKFTAASTFTDQDNPKSNVHIDIEISPEEFSAAETFTDRRQTKANDCNHNYTDKFNSFFPTQALLDQFEDELTIDDLGEGVVMGCPINASEGSSTFRTSWLP